METCGIIPSTDCFFPTYGEILPCLRPDGHQSSEAALAEQHLSRRSDGTYFMWYYDYEDHYEGKDDEDYVYYEVSEEEAQRYLKDVIR